MERHPSDDKSIFTNRNIGIVLTLLCLAALFYYWQQDWVFQRLRDRFLLGLLTLVSLFWIVGCAVLLTLDRHRSQVMTGLRQVFSPLIVVILAIPIGAYGFFAASLWAGFPIGMVLFATLGTYVLGLRPWVSALASGAAIAAVVYTLFWLIGEPLPLGRLDTLIRGA